MGLLDSIKSWFTTPSRNKTSGSTFLGVPARSLTVEKILEKGRRDKAAARQRAPIVNRAIEKQNQTINKVLSYPKAAENTWHTSVNDNTNNKIIESVRNTIVGQSQALPEAYSYRYSGGQFTGVGKQTQDFREALRPKTFTELAEVAAKRDTETDSSLRDYYVTETLDQHKHDEIIEWGEAISQDNEAALKWVLSAPTVEEQYKRMEQVQKYAEDATKVVDIFDGANVIQTAQISESASLPPWIAATPDNLNKWDYYKTYFHNVTQVHVDAYNKYTEEAKRKKKNPYESAFSSEHDPNSVDSFLDVFIASKGENITEWSKSFDDNMAEYFKKYILNPMKHGPKGMLTAAGNALWNMMDTMDVASRGVRAFVAGDMTLGGSGGKEFKNANSAFDDYYAKTWEKYGVEPSDEYKRNQYHGTWERGNDAKFKGQNVYWVNLEGHTEEESMRAQQLFMDNGGDILLLKAHPGEATKAQLGEMSISDEELTAQLDAAFAGSDIDWHDIYNDIDENFYSKDRAKRDITQAIENVKKTYSEPEAAFNADTGSMAADILVESVLDPGLIVGGLSKTVASGTVSSVADNAVKEGFLSIFKNADEVPEFMNHKAVRGAIKDLVRMNDGKNIIFKKADAFDDDLNVLVSKLRNTGIFDSAKTGFDTAEEAAEYFKRTVTGHLMGKQISVNGKILASTDFARRALDEKTFKAAYAMDKAIDGIDSAIVKSSFMLPWGTYKLAKAGLPVVADMPVFRHIAAKRELRIGQALSDMLDTKTGAVNVMSIDKVFQKVQRGVVKDREWHTALQVAVDEYDEVARSINSTIRDFSTGKVTAEDAVKQVREYISQITGGKYSDIRELKAYVDRIDVRYAGDIQLAFDRISKTYDKLTEAINKGYDKTAAAKLEKKAIDAGIQGVSKVSKKTVRRTIGYDQFMKALSDVGIDLETKGKAYEKLGDFVKAWESDTYVRYNTSDVLKQIDKFERSAYFSNLVNVREVSETAALNAHAVLGEFNALRRKIKHMDLLSLKHGDYVYLMHTDRMALHTELMNSSAVQDMYETVDEQIVQVLLKDFKGMTTEKMDLATSQLAQTLQTLSEFKYGFDRTNILIDEIKNLPGFSDEKLNTILNGVANNFGFHGELEDLLSNPTLLKKQLETTLRARSAESKLSRAAMAEALRGLSSGNPPEFMKRYTEELEDPAVKQVLDKYINKAVSDPTSYVETQMLYTALADPSVIGEWDALAKAGQAPIGFHVNSTGLSSEINNITSVSLRKWVPVNLEEGETLTLKRLLEAFDQGETEVIGRRGVNIKDYEFTENVLRRMDMKGATKKQMLDAFRKTHDANLKVALDSEEDVIREVCKYFKDSSVVMKDGVPTFEAPSVIVHDLDGFNIPYFTNKAGALRKGLNDETDAVVNYFDNLSYRMDRNQINTFSRLSDQVGDYAYSEGQIQDVLRLMQDYADDINHFGKSYRFMDTSSYTRALEDLHSSVELNIKAGKATEAEKRFSALYGQAEADMLLAEYDHVVRDIEKLTLQPRGYAFVMSGTEVNPVHAALRATGRDTINVESRMYVDDVLAYFDIDVEDGFVVSVEDFRKMHELSSYIVRNHERAIVDGAEEFLAKYKSRFDQMIQSMKNLAQSDGWDSTQLSYIKDITIPDNAVDSYLMAKKLYQDHMRFWLDEALDGGVSREGRNLDDMKANLQKVRATTAQGDIRREVESNKLFKAACEYDKKFRRRFFDELTTGGFNVTRAEHVQDILAEQGAAWNAFDEFRSEYWHEVSNEMSQMWDDYREASAAWDELRASWGTYREAKSNIYQDYSDLKSELWDGFKQTKEELSDELAKKYPNVDQALIDAYKMETEYRSYLYEDLKKASDTGWNNYRIRKAEHEKLYESVKSESDALWTEWKQRYREVYAGRPELTDTRNKAYNAVKARSDALWEKYFASKAELSKMRDELRSIWDEYKETQERIASYKDVKQYFIEKAELRELAADEVQRIKQYSTELNKLREKDIQVLYDTARQEADRLYEQASQSSILLEEARMNSQLHFDEALDNYQALSLNYLTEQQAMLHHRLDFLSFASEDYSDDVLSLLEGSNQPQIYKKAARSDFEKKVLRYENDVLKDGIDAARKCSEAGSEIKSNMRQLNHIDSMMNAMGASRRDTILLGATHQKAAKLFDILKESGLAERQSFRNFLERVSELRHMQLQQANLNKFKVDGKFDRNAVFSELLYNGFNMSVFNAHSYTVTEMRELKRYIRKLRREGDDFISIFEDRSTGNVFVYLNNKATISEAGDMRYINNKFGFNKPAIRDHILFPEFDELAKYMDMDDLEDFRGVYNHLVSCWDDTRMLSQGMINGTSGRTVSMRQAEDFMKSLPDEMSDWCTSEGLLRSEISRGVIYDPGFVRNDAPDVLFDFMDTLHAQADVVKEDTMLANMVFNKNESVQFRELAENFTDEELMQYFGENSEYVVCSLIADLNTATGFSVRQLKVNNKASLEMAKMSPNTTILPYDAFYEIAEIMNRSTTDNVYRRIVSKYMQLYKAFALIKPGTWMRNYIDATMKAGIDNGEGATGIFSMLQYEAKAVRDINTYYKIAKADPSLLNKANWDVIQKSLKTDMPYEDFELLKGVLDGSSYYTADKKYLQRTINRRGNNVISGKDIGLRNLDEKDFDSAFKKYMSNEVDLPLSKEEFKKIYFKKLTPDEQTNELYEEMFRKFSDNLRRADATNIYDRATNAMFIPFGSVENVVRYAQTSYLRDLGFSENQIMRHIHATQFYTAPSWTTMSKLEVILPFITFKFNNVMYWIKMMDENPRFFRYFEDMYGSISDETIESAEQQGQDIDYAEDYALQSGGIPIGCGKAYLNINNSFLNAMNDFYGLANNIDSLNPLFKDTVRSSLYALGFQSSNFFEGVDLDPTDEDMRQKLVALVPGGTLTRSGYYTFKNVYGKSTETGGPNMDAIYSALNFLGVLGVRKSYQKDAGFDFNAWQEELAAQGLWYDCNQGKVVSLVEYNEYGANDPNNSFQDTQAYMLVHFGKIWDANQHKFVTFDEYQEGGLNDGFDFENDDEAWEKLVEYQKSRGKYYDYNQRKFVLMKDYIHGGLNNKYLDWDTKVMLMEEKFPNLKWDANQGAFVEADKYIAGGLNNTQNFSEVIALRRALYGEEYNPVTHKFEKTGEPQVVLLNNALGVDRDLQRYDRYYAMLGITRLQEFAGNIAFNSEGLLVNKDGQYVLTGDAEYDQKIFNKFQYADSGFGGRKYGGWKNYSYNKTKRAPKPYKGRTLPTSYYTHYGYENMDSGANFQFQFQYNYKYHAPQPGRTVHMLASPRINYPFGGGYNKFSYYRR